MSVLFTNSDNDGIYANATPASDYPFLVTIPFKVTAWPSSGQGLFWLGDKDAGNAYIELALWSSGVCATRDRSVNSSFLTTANTASTSATNIVTAIYDTGGDGGDTRWRLKLNGGSVATFETSNPPNSSGWDRFAIGRYMDASPGGSFDGWIEQPFLDVLPDDNGTFDDHDTLWNSGSGVLDPSVESVTADHRWPFDETSGTVGATDTEIDDAVGSVDLDTLNGSPEYGATIFSAGGGGGSRLRRHSWDGLGRRRGFVGGGFRA